ncbi:serine hydrolase domain-containing protein [Nonomuraea sediminis]|uniref:serine hydrolase domain-containing protein n=1 Tax=Nonomuraea sediminis TaxID=2835864 RepID=UPI001BDBF5B2|nr:serine hydrolase domain-containing protein [Nonomuraea sediminis]
MSHEKLAEFIRAAAEEFGIPGAAVGVWVGGEEIYACHGVTSIENPLAVDENTLFQLASITKTYTATALMRLVEAGKVELDAPVRRYVPEFPLDDEQVTVGRLLNHTAGLDWAVIVDTGEGDDALAAYVRKMGELIAPPGTRASYSQAGYNLVGRVIENVTGLPYEKAVAELVLGPAGLENSFFAAQDVITRRFAVGHNLGEDGTLSVARPWKGTRANNPGGGLVSSVADQLRWARYHLEGDATLRGMREPTVALRASSLGDAIGTAWFLRDVDGVRTVGHGGSANGMFGELLLVPERDFAVVVVSNAGPNGIPFDQAIVRWALEHYLGVIDRDPEPIPFDAARFEEIVGTYDIDAMTLTITADGQEPAIEVRIRPEIRAAADTELPQDHAPFPFGLLPGDTDEYVIIEGAFKGQRGFFTRDATGTITGVDLAGRLFNRT